MLILLLALLLRLRHLGHESLWFDEMASVRIAQQDLATMLSFIKWEERIPPLHYLILHGWVRMFGVSEISVRFPSVLAGTAAVWAVYRLGSGLFGAGAGLTAALLMAVSGAQILYSQEARSYSLMVLLSVLSCDLFMRLIRRPTARRELVYVIVTTLLLYSHLYGVFAVAAQHVAYLVIRLRRGSAALDTRRWIVLNMAVAALFSPWIPVVVRWVRSVNTSFWQTPMTADEIAATYRLYLGSTAMTVACLALAVMGVVRLRRHVGLALVLGLATLPVIVPILVSILTRPTFTYRYGLAAPAGLFILAGCGVIALPGSAVRCLAAAVLVALSLAGNALRSEKEPWRDVIAYVSDHARPGDYVIFSPRLTTYLFDHYATRTDIRRKGFDTGTIPLGLPRPPGETIWLVYDARSGRMNDVLRRGNWRVRCHRGFDGLVVVQLDDADPAETPAFLPSTTPASRVLSSASPRRSATP